MPGLIGKDTRCSGAVRVACTASDIRLIKQDENTAREHNYKICLSLAHSVKAESQRGPTNNNVFYLTCFKTII